MITPEQRNPAGNRQIGTEGDRRGAVLVAQTQHDQAQHGAHQRRQQDGQRQHLPATPGAQHRQQLEVAMAHAFLAGHQLEQPIHRPQAHIAGHRAPHGVIEAGEQALAIEDQPKPEQWQHQ
ncbi:hypothetical protein FQZ97_961600 [compost metagenome]